MNLQYMMNSDAWRQQQKLVQPSGKSFWHLYSWIGKKWPVVGSKFGNWCIPLFRDLCSCSRSSPAWTRGEQPLAFAVSFRLVFVGGLGSASELVSSFRSVRNAGGPRGLLVSSWGRFGCRGCRRGRLGGNTRASAWVWQRLGGTRGTYDRKWKGGS